MADAWDDRCRRGFCRGSSKAAPWIGSQGLFRPWTPDRGSSAIPWTPAPPGGHSSPVPPAAMERRTWRGHETPKVGAPACLPTARWPGRGAVWSGEFRSVPSTQCAQTTIAPNTQICALATSHGRGMAGKSGPKPDCALYTISYKKWLRRRLRRG
jgi:hypothetical protein